MKSNLNQLFNKTGSFGLFVDRPSIRPNLPIGGDRGTGIWIAGGELNPTGGEIGANDCC